MDLFQDTLTSVMDNFIPNKQINNTHQLPWVTHKIKKIIRKKNKIYSKLKSSKSANVLKQYEAIKHRLQKDMRNAYWTYIDTYLTIRKKITSQKGSLAPLRSDGTKQPSSIINLARYSPKNPEDQCQTKGL